MLTKSLALWLLLCVNLLAVRSAEAQEGEPQANAGTIQRVTLYRDQALVTRVIEVSAGEPQRELLIGRLPEQVAPDSVFAEGNTTTNVHGVRVTQRTADKADDAARSELTDQLDALHKQQSSIEHQLGLAQKKSLYIDQLMNFSATTSQADLNRGVLDSATLTELSDYAMQQVVELGTAVKDLQDELVDNQEQVVELMRELQLLNQPSSTRYEVRLLVETTGGAAGSVELSYLVSGCGWSPQYTLRGAIGQETFGLRYNALVEQMSGEDWQNVQLTLSTASPSMSAAGPALIPFRVAVAARSSSMGSLGNGPFGDDPFGNDSSGEDLFGAGQTGSKAVQQQAQSLKARQQAVVNEYAGKHSDQENMQRDYALNSVASEVQNLELLADSKQLKTLAADSADEVASQTYLIEQAVSLDSRREQQLVQILDAQLEGELYHVATPLLSSFAYREADMINNRTEGLLRGPATIFLDDRFVGRAEIPSIASGQHLVVGFGADPQVRTRRELLDKADEVQGGNRRLTFKYRLVLANFKDRPVHLRLYDRLPLANQTAEISVRPLEFQLPISTDGLYLRLQQPRGVLRWDVEVPAERFGEQAFDVDYSYSVEFDRNRVLSAVASDDQIESDLRELAAPSSAGGMGGGMGGMGGRMAPGNGPQP